MLRKIVVALLIWICFLLQSTVFGSLSIGGIMPNLMIILTSAFGFMRSDKEGLVIGFVCGLLCDIFSGDVLGFYALILMYIGFINGKFSGIFYPQDIKLPIALIVTSDLTYGTVIYVLRFLLRGKFSFAYYAANIIVPEAVYTIVVTIVLYPIILWINERLESREKRSAQIFV